MDKIFREAHLFTEEDSRELREFERCLPKDVSRKLDCVPDGVGGICFSLPEERYADFESLAKSLGLGSQLGIGGVTWVATFALGDYLYAINTVPEFKIYDISDPTTPVNTDTLALSGTPTALWLDESIAYVANSDGQVFRINIDDPTTATLDSAETTETAVNITHLRVAGELMVVSGAGAGVVALYDNGQIPAKLIQDTEGTPDVVGSAIALQGRRLLFGDASGAPCLLRSYRIGGFRCFSIEAVMLHAIELACELIEARHGYFKGDLFANSLTLHDELEISGLVFVDSVDGSLQRLTIATGVLTVTPV